MDPHVDVRRLEYLAVAVPHARLRDPLLAVPGKRGEAVVKRVEGLVLYVGQIYPTPFRVTVAKVQIIKANPLRQLIILIKAKAEDYP